MVQEKPDEAKAETRRENRRTRGNDYDPNSPRGGLWWDRKGKLVGYASSEDSPMQSFNPLTKKRIRPKR